MRDTLHHALDDALNDGDKQRFEIATFGGEVNGADSPIVVAFATNDPSSRLHTIDDTTHRWPIAEGRVGQIALLLAVRLPEANQDRPLLGCDVLAHFFEFTKHLVSRSLVDAVDPKAQRVVDHHLAARKLVFHRPQYGAANMVVNATM